MDIEKNIEKKKAMIALFNAVAHAEYMRNTYKSSSDLRVYLEKYTNDWAEVMLDVDFYSVNDCIEAARSVALRVVDKENFKRFFDSLG